MPGLRKDLDTSDWKVSAWQRARIWNLAFVVGWLSFFGFALRASFASNNWYWLVPLLLVAVISGTIPIIWLVRISIWLDNQQNSKSTP